MVRMPAMLDDSRVMVMQWFGVGMHRRRIQ
jgi:hypothetical protein